MWLVRHGETEWSRDGRHTGTTDIPLTDVGRDQARRLGTRLAGHRFALVMTSPRSRAAETAALAGFGDVASTRTWRGDYGALEGRRSVEIVADYPGWAIWTGPWPGGETVAEVSARADRVLARCHAPRSKATRCSSGMDMLRVLAARWLGLPAALARSSASRRRPSRSSASSTGARSSRRGTRRSPETTPISSRSHGAVADRLATRGSLPPLVHIGSRGSAPCPISPSIATRCRTACASSCRATTAHRSWPSTCGTTSAAGTRSLGKTGFAHLFEHMMFQVCPRRQGRALRPGPGRGGTLNASTWLDRTNYFDTLPSHELELPPWLESDRLASLLPAMTQEKLDNQRDVVKNERRWSVDNQLRDLGREAAGAPLPGGTPITIPPSARWRTSTLPRWTTCASSSPPTTRRTTPS